MSDTHSFSTPLLSCFLNVLSILFSPLHDDDYHRHHPILLEDTLIREKNTVSSNIMAQKQFRQLHQIKGP
ncbi:hypothetical protein HanRHA438_Chr14g0657811 [Helianthus annuus]|nr:hypothetical protein HanIR_Chr14g0701931 [Helianthus annuus]KAJ0854011.1 hypothetical protein HanRHA438_Chr14g0657811 [Helianthus annuus]